MARNKPHVRKSESVDDEDTIDIKREPSGDGDLASEMESAVQKEESAGATSSPSLHPTKLKQSRSPSISSLNRSKSHPDDSEVKPKPEKLNGHISPVKPETPKVKMGRVASNKGPPPRVAPLFDHLPDVKSEATSVFQVIDSSTYQNKYLGFTESALECDCSEEWDSVNHRNDACGDNSDCINRATKMECGDDCSCGDKCQNQRFTRRLYADVSVIQTEKKGYGLRTNVDLKPNDFIFEYIGEVIGENAFRRRMVNYDQEGIKHFYFMSLSKGEFIDATRKGNLGRFCNHSCNPNCYVDKWVIGEKLRMGIFAERHIKAGEELVFNYNVDRYGANPQPCYCGETNCTGFIGGKTQTERATKLSAATIEALGLEDYDDDWDIAVAKKPKKKKTAEDDEEYVENAPSKTLDADGVTKVMAALMQCKEKWIAVKLFQRIQNSGDEMVQHRIVRLHGYRILNSQLSAWKDDENIILQILDILDKLPRLTRNKIVDARLDQTLEKLSEHDDQRVVSQAKALLDIYSSLELAYRIPRKKKDETSTPVKIEPSLFDRRETTQRKRSRSRSRSRSKSPPRGPSAISAPSGPRAQRPGFPTRPPPPFARGPLPLPQGWFTANDKGRTYFYSASGKTSWVRPSQPDVPPPPPKQPSEQDVLKSIIDNIVTTKEKEKDGKDLTPDTPAEQPKPKKEERWKSYDEEKKMKLYENTLFPHISHVMNKYKHKIPKDDLKRFAKEVSKKLSASDFKAGRVKDPTKIDEKQQKKVKEFCKQFFDRAAHKHKKQAEERTTNKGHNVEPAEVESPPMSPKIEHSPDIKAEDEDVKMIDPEATPEIETPSEQSTSLKRKHDEISPNIKKEENPPKSPLKKLAVSTPPPPPPPPPPAPPVETPPGSTPREEMEVEVDLHDEGDTNFKDKSMADVRALAQMEGDDDEDEDETMDNPLVDAQPVVQGT